MNVLYPSLCIYVFVHSRMLLLCLMQGYIFWQITPPPLGVEEISKYPKKEEEIEIFYCLALNNEEGIERR